MGDPLAGCKFAVCFNTPLTDESRFESLHALYFLMMQIAFGLSFDEVDHVGIGRLTGKRRDETDELIGGSGQVQCIQGGGGHGDGPQRKWLELRASPASPNRMFQLQLQEFPGLGGELQGQHGEHVLAEAGDDGAHRLVLRDASGAQVEQLVLG